MAAALGVAALLATTSALIAWQTSEPTAKSAPKSEPIAAAESSETEREPAPVVTSASKARSSTPASVTPSDDPERAASLEIQSLVRAGRIGPARARANAYYERFPNGPATREIERLTGAHPVVDGRP